MPSKIVTDSRAMTCVVGWQRACSNNISKNVYLQHSRNFRLGTKSELNKFMHSDDFMVELIMKDVVGYCRATNMM